MKMNYVMILVLLFILPYTVNAQRVKQETKIDTIEICFYELLDVDYRFKVILDDFIKHLPFSLKRYQRTNFIYADINAYLTHKVQKRVIDSLYQDNDFRIGIYSFPYDVSVKSFRKKSNRLLTVSDYQRCYLYNYKGFDVILVSPLQLEFPWLGASVTKRFPISKMDDYSFDYFSVYTIGDFEVVKRKYIRLYSQPSGIPLKKKYSLDKEKSDLLKR